MGQLLAPYRFSRQPTAVRPKKESLPGTYVLNLFLLQNKIVLRIVSSSDSVPSPLPTIAVESPGPTTIIPTSLRGANLVFPFGIDGRKLGSIFDIFVNGCFP